MGGTFVAEEWPEDRRKPAAGWIHTAYYVGFFLAGLGKYLVGACCGWRAMFALGGLPVLLVGCSCPSATRPKGGICRRRKDFQNQGSWNRGVSSGAKLRFLQIVRSQLKLRPPKPSIVNRLIRQFVHLPVEFQVPGRVQLSHEHDDHLLFGIDGKRCVEEAAPAK